MAVNEILQFCGTDTGTNLESQSDYAADSQRTDGNQPGIAKSKLVNKALRQSSFIATAFAQFLVNTTGSDILDNGDEAGLITLITNALAPTPTGLIQAFGGGTAPSGYLLCDGSLVSRVTYPGLFTAIGSTWGSGDGSTTFSLPDLRGQFLRGRMPNLTATGSGSVSSNNATFTTHGFNRTGIQVRMSSGALTGLATNTDYWLIVIDANTLAFASSYANALAGTKISISGTNSAVIVQSVDPDAASRQSNASGGNAGANIGSIELDAEQGHLHEQNSSGGAGGATGYLNTASQNWSIGAIGAYFTDVPSSDGINGLVRTSSETRPKNANVMYIIKT